MVLIMMTALMWRREMTSKYNITVGCKLCEDCCESVHINLKPHTGDLDAFIDIYTDDGDGTSPFKTVEDAKLFAEIIGKLLDAVGDSYDIKR